MTTVAHMKTRAKTLTDDEIAATLKTLKHDKEANPAWLDALEAEEESRKGYGVAVADVAVADDEETPPKPRKTTARKTTARKK